MLDPKIEKTQNQIKDSSTLSNKLTLKSVQDIFIRFSSILKMAQIYEPNNLIFRESVVPFHTLIQDFLAREGQALFQFQDGTLFFNKDRIKFNYVNYSNLKYLAEEFQKKEIGSLGFEPGLSQKELTQFVVLLAKAKDEIKNPFEDFKTKLEEWKIEHIYLEKLHPHDIVARTKTEQVRKVAKKVFFKSMTHLKESFERENQQQKLDIKTSRRLIQSVINLISKDESFMMGLTNIKNYDEYTVNHSVNVAVLALCFGKRLGLEKSELLELGLSAFFHDIGKLDIPKEILIKKDRLTKEEKAIMEKHTFKGVEKLLNLKESSHLPIKALYVALEHHIWSNLSGYPKYWKRDKVSLFSKIVKICDFFDSVTTERPYRDFVFTREEALSLMLETSGTEFDSVLLKVFSSLMSVYPVGTLVALDTKELGIVMEANPDVAFTLRPKVKLITDAKGKKTDGEIVDLKEMDPQKGRYKRTIVKPLNPHEYNVTISDYFLVLQN